LGPNPLSLPRRQRQLQEYYQEHDPSKVGSVEVGDACALQREEVRKEEVRKEEVQRERMRRVRACTLLVDKLRVTGCGVARHGVWCGSSRGVRFGFKSRCRPQLEKIGHIPSLSSSTICILLCSYLQQKLLDEYYFVDIVVSLLKKFGTLPTGWYVYERSV
jgi:hypothetical protein